MRVLIADDDLPLVEMMRSLQQQDSLLKATFHAPVSPAVSQRPLPQKVHTVIQAYSPPEYRGRTMALFHMTQVILMIGGLLIGALSAFLGAQSATALMSVAGTMAMVGIYALLPQARKIR